MARTITIDCSAAANAEIERLRDITGESTADFFRHALSIYRDKIILGGNRGGEDDPLSGIKIGPKP